MREKNEPPNVSIIVPCYNEQTTISLLLESILDQTVDSSEVEVVIADGLSEDETREIIQKFDADHPELEIKLVDNPARIIPAALNKAIEHSQGEVIIRLDAHSIPDKDYIERCLDTLKDTNAANVGGIWIIRPASDHWISHAIASAAAHPIGAGDALYRVHGNAGPVDTVPFGAFPRKWLDKVGPFNESLLTNEDYEYNVRIRKAGGIVWLDPSIQSEYYARKNLGELARQYSRYGFWKAMMLRRYPETLRWRQALPPVFVLSMITLAVLASFIPLALVLLGVQLGAYLLITVGMGLREGVRKRDAGIALGFAPSIWVMHISWGASFLWGLISGQRSR